MDSAHGFIPETPFAPVLFPAAQPNALPLIFSLIYIQRGVSPRLTPL